MKRHVILKQQRKKTSITWEKKIEESKLEVYRRFHDEPNEAGN